MLVFPSFFFFGGGGGGFNYRDEPAMRQQHLTISCKEKISVCDVTEFQVK
jgi:hypothetical protein